MERIHRLNADLTPPYVALDKYERMPELAAAVKAQCIPNAPLHSLVARVADLLVANLFYFEPACATADGFPAIELRQAKPRPTYRLRGTIRCRLARGGNSLKQLARRVERFAHKELAPAAPALDGRDRDGWGPVPLSEDVRVEVQAHDGWLRVPVHVLVHEEEPARQVLALVLRGREDEAPIPISGFPVTLSELRGRAGIARP